MISKGDTMFVLDARLQSDSFHLAALPLCDALLAKNAHYVWVILVPRIAGVVELIDLDNLQQQQLLLESNTVSRWLQQLDGVDKINVAALGNVVSQLHVHHVGRAIGDPAWPGPVWGHAEFKAYDKEALAKLKQSFQSVLV